MNTNPLVYLWLHDESEQNCCPTTEFAVY